jgi:hypothetical protein
MFGYRRARVNHSGVTPASRPAPESAGCERAARTVSRRALARELVLAAAVAVAAVLVLRGPATTQAFTIDESRWIATSRYFWITFVDRDLFGPAWQPNYVVLTQPPLARYLIGFGLWLQGWTPERLNGRYDSLQSRAYNERAGNVPDDDLLEAARRVTFVFGVCAVVLVYAAGRGVGGPVAGLAAAALALASPLLTGLWTRALAESIVAAFSLLTLALALRVMPIAARPGRLVWLPLATGAALALAAATKLNGAIGGIGLALFALSQQGQALLTTRRTAGLRSWVDIGLAAIVLFVAVNPLLYPRPIDRSLALVRYRQDEMQFQRSVFVPQAVPDDLTERVKRVGLRVFSTYATPRGPVPIAVDGVLVAVGLAVLARRADRDLRRRRAGPALLLLCWVAASYAVITANLGFDSSHYYAPLVTLNVLVMGVAIESAGRRAHQLVRRAPGLDRRARRQKTQAPAT